MECGQKRSAQLMEYAEGMLLPAEAAELEMHLSGCASCRQELEGWRQLEARLRAFPLVAEPRGFTSAVMSQVAQPQVAVPVAFRPVDPVVVLALGALLLGVGTLLSGSADWEWQIDWGTWVNVAWGFAGSWLALAAVSAWEILGQVLDAAYSGLMDSAPVLMAAVLLALFALGPKEIIGELGSRARQS